MERGTGVEDGADGLEDDGVVVAEGEGAGAGEAVEVAAAVGSPTVMPRARTGTTGSERA